MMYREIEDTELRLQKDNGYLYFIDRNHPLKVGNSDKVYLHRHNMSVKLNRWISSLEHVHHIDGIKTNNKLDNLQLLSNAEHRRIHSPEKVQLICNSCGTLYEVPEDRRTTSNYCSNLCSGKGKIKSNVTKQELQDLIDSGIPWTKIAIQYNYSDSGIRKRAIALGCRLK